MVFLDHYLPDIAALCQSHKVKSLYVFGSVLKDKFNDESDLDFVVDFQPQDVLDYGDNYFDLKFSLQDMFKRSIDLLEEKAIRNPYLRENIEQQRKLVYGK